MTENKQEEINLKALNRNIQAIHRARKEADESRSWKQKMADDVAFFLSSLNNLYLHFFGYSTFIGFLIFKTPVAINNWLDLIGAVTSVASFEALFFTIFILINQRRIHSLERRNLDLHLQMSMLAEHEITRLVQLTEQIGIHLGLPLSQHPDELNEIKKDVHPDLVIKKILEEEAESPTDSTKGTF